MFEWKEMYSTDVAEIDKQHKRLLELGSKLYELIKLMDDYSQDDYYDDIKDVLAEVAEYTVYHFDYEEGLMEKAGYDKLDEHKVHHSNFVAKLNELNDKDIDENQKDFLMEMVEFVAGWISEHILKVDQDYKILFKLRGIE